MSKKRILDVPKVKQLKNYCGPASLSMVFAYHGKHLTQEEIADEITATLRNGYYQRTPIRKNGIYANDLAVYAKNKDFEVRYYLNSSLEKLIELIDSNIPPIVGIDDVKDPNEGHFSVVKGYDFEKSLIYYNDPDNLRRSKLRLKQFKKLWLTENSSPGFWNEMIAIWPKRNLISIPFLFQNTKDKGQAQKEAV